MNTLELFQKIVDLLKDQPVIAEQKIAALQAAIQLIEGERVRLQRLEDKLFRSGHGIKEVDEMLPASCI